MLDMSSVLGDWDTEWDDSDMEIKKNELKVEQDKIDALNKKIKQKK